MADHVQTQAEWQQAMARRVMERVRSELYLELRYMNAALGALALPPDPQPARGLAANGALHTKPGTLPFRLVMNLSINLIFTVLMSAVMTALNVLVLEGGTLPMFLGSYAGSLIPMYLASCLVSWVAEPPAGRAAARLAGG